MRSLITSVFVLFLFFPAMTAAVAAENGINVSKVWARPVFMAGRTGAAYFLMNNSGQDDDRLLSVRTSLSNRAELHEHIYDQGVMKMRQVDHVAVPSGEHVVFKPGGYHVMIFDVKRVLAEGDSFPLTLVFEHAGEIEVTAHVMKQAPAEGHDHSGHH
ncbi:copper chaperone PCu(A)C [Emcibacter sp.]|uniref:copper chaperone PCu(A)C n=1 Tax=Emcibacter sp. TaxID=1979954 RepID=UPI003A8DC1D7